MTAGRPGTAMSRVRVLAVLGALTLSIIALGILGVVLGDVSDGGDGVDDDRGSDQSSDESPWTGDSESDDSVENDTEDGTG